MSMVLVHLWNDHGKRSGQKKPRSRLSFRRTEPSAFPPRYPCFWVTPNSGLITTASVCLPY